jgi:hypothetical protein
VVASQPGVCLPASLAAFPGATNVNPTATVIDPAKKGDVKLASAGANHRPLRHRPTGSAPARTVNRPGEACYSVWREWSVRALPSQFEWDQAKADATTRKHGVS